MNIKKVLKDIRLEINRMGASNRRKKLNTTDFSIISNNCFAGIVYQHFGLQYNTPTIGLYFYPEEYIKFCRNFNDYIKEDLTFIRTSESKYFDDLKKNHYENTIVGKLKDVEIVFLHYETQEEAKKKWDRRIKRLSKNIIYKFNDQNGCTYDQLKQFDDLQYKNKIIFTAKEYPDLKTNVFMKKYRNCVNIKEDYYSCYKYIDLIDFINKSKQGAKDL